MLRPHGMYPGTKIQPRRHRNRTFQSTVEVGDSTTHPLRPTCDARTPCNAAQTVQPQSPAAAAFKNEWLERRRTSLLARPSTHISPPRGGMRNRRNISIPSLALYDLNLRRASFAILEPACSERTCCRRLSVQRGRRSRHQFGPERWAG
jgi:hypothetical protein